MKVTDEDLALMTDEEREAFLADPDDAAELAALSADPDDEDDEPAPKAEAEDDDEAEDKPEAKPEPAAEDEPDEQPAAEQQPAPAYKFDAPADATTQLAALKAEERAAFAELMAGEMTTEKYNEIRDRTEAESDALKAAQIQARVSAEMQAQAAEREWRAACSTFASKTKTAEGIDYEGNKILGRAFDAEVKELALKPENAQRPAEWFLTEAHKAVKEAFGIKPAAAPAPAANRPTRPPASAIPPSISKLPAAAESLATENKWAYLDKMSGVQREKAIAAMSAQELDEYMDSEAR
jgi:hypothetical protein